MKASVIVFEAGNRSMLAFSLSICQVGEKNYKIDIHSPPLSHCRSAIPVWQYLKLNTYLQESQQNPLLPSHFHHNCHIIWNTECLHDMSPSFAPLSIFRSRRVCHLLVEMESCKSVELNDGYLLNVERWRRSWGAGIRPLNVHDAIVSDMCCNFPALDIYWYTLSF